MDMIYKILNIKDLPNEIWYDIPNTNNMYKISNLGRLKSLHGNHKIIKQFINNKGYCKGALKMNSKRDNFFIHRLLAISAIDNLENKPQINHKNGIRHDNKIENLEWNTNSENNLHSYRQLKREPSRSYIGRFGKLHHASKKVKCDTFDLIFDSARTASRELGISQGSISHTCNGRQLHTSGLVFKYI